jgi:hypothetical protein
MKLFAGETVDEAMERMIGRDNLRRGISSYGKQAFLRLAEDISPPVSILHSGSAISACELAVIADVRITALVPDKHEYRKAKVWIKNLRLGEKIQLKQKGKFSKFKVDLFWSEGSEFAEDMKRKVKSISALPCAVFHIPDVHKDELIALAGEQGFKLSEERSIPVDVWVKEYYRPLEQRLQEIQRRYSGVRSIQEYLKRDEAELNALRDDPNAFSSSILIFKKG